MHKGKLFHIITYVCWDWIFVMMKFMNNYKQRKFLPLHQ